MELTRTERLILHNQYRILALLDRENAADHAEAQLILENGYAGEYDDLASHIREECLTQEECMEVWDILEMHQRLARANELLDEGGKVDPDSIKFRGFDGNNETKQMDYARFICNSGTGRFAELQGREAVNSHSPTLAHYRRMLRVFQEVSHKWPMDAEDIRAVVNARWETH